MKKITLICALFCLPAFLANAQDAAPNQGEGNKRGPQMMNRVKDSNQNPSQRMMEKRGERRDDRMENRSDRRDERRDDRMENRSDRRDERRERFENASPEQKQKMMERREKFQSLSPEKKAEVKQEIQRHRQEMQRITGSEAN